MNQTDVQHLPQAASTPAVPSHTRIAVISANWHDDIVHQARDSAIKRLVELGATASHIETFELPGAFEIPLLAKKLADSGQFDAVIACALIVNGGIYRHEFVTTAVIDGLMRVQLDSGVPVFSVALTPLNFHDHDEHRDYFFHHFVKKGEEAANACARTLAQHAAVNEKLLVATAAAASV
ncbi:6,7-dimethyl-8-ribityllumazine synthase [Diaphorobacter aerolatus]|uniref:6,7-dimethyl-8-ribityllumazine synthase n=1 Tax=Diaphorobacter aerolatus TaxID=1288495 RepID=A0A7H0GNB5_9BURK|nr:6,7-dimethyl-8-ribityllumazine synthase [Diaphorobacter aerolatus]QNP49781.1 6,7-dimethyl-8-ribityllumazine synthase [Diaphorobacter aerolatus]